MTWLAPTPAATTSAPPTTMKVTYRATMAWIRLLAALQQAGDAGSVELSERVRVAGHLVGRSVQPLEVGLGETARSGQALRDGPSLLAQPPEVAENFRVLLLGGAELTSVYLAERHQRRPISSCMSRASVVRSRRPVESIW